jgi:hypothetical protein
VHSTVLRPCVAQPLHSCARVFGLGVLGFAVLDTVFSDAVLDIVFADAVLDTVTGFAVLDTVLGADGFDLSCIRLGRVSGAPNSVIVPPNAVLLSARVICCVNTVSALAVLTQHPSLLVRHSVCFAAREINLSC